MTYQPMSLNHWNRPLKTLPPDKFFQNLSLAEYLTFFWTRFGKIEVCGVKIVTGLIKEIQHFTG